MTELTKKLNIAFCKAIGHSWDYSGSFARKCKYCGIEQIKGLYGFRTTKSGMK